MKRTLLSLWHALGSINLTVILCLALTADLLFGYGCLVRHTSLFTPLSDMGLAPWLQTYGRFNLTWTGWFFLLLVLLVLFALNTFVCTTNRIVQLFSAQRSRDWKRLVPMLAPHVMHYGLIVILCGYLASYLLSQVLTGQTLVPGLPLSLPGTGGRITLQSLETKYYQGTRLSFLSKQAITGRAHLLLDDGKTQKKAVLAFNHPVRFQGYSIHLANFFPRSLGGMKMKTRVDLFIRRDPGIPLYLAGIVLFTLGLALYIGNWHTQHEVSKS